MTQMQGLIKATNKDLYLSTLRAETSRSFSKRKDFPAQGTA